MSGNSKATVFEPRAQPGLEPSWPLSVLFLGFPIFWAMGLSASMALIMAVPMVIHLTRASQVRFPAGFTTWLLFLVIAVASALMLMVDAPTAVPGGGFGRVPVFLFRLLWYVTCGVVVLWVCNMSEEDLPTRKVVDLLGVMFVVTVFGGLLGVMMPNFEFKSLVEFVLPSALAKNGFLRPLIHPAAASIQNMGGSIEARPIAPFEFANSWGANFSMFLPFFCISWFRRDAGWRRAVAPVILILGAIPVVSSLDRGLWGAMMIGGAYLLVRLALRGSILPLVASVAVALIAVLAFLASPLATSVSERLDNPHSNSRRGQLLSQTVSSTASGSPVIGFGGTRDVQGSFASIAGGSTSDCKACAVPPLGTQGQLWLVIFTQGFLGAAFFFAFFFIRGAYHLRSETTLEAVGVCLIIFFLVEAVVYDTLGMPLYTLMIAIALMWRERHVDPRRPSDGSDVRALLTSLRRQQRSIVACSLVGLLIGGYFATQLRHSTTSVVSVLLAPAPVYLGEESDREPKSITVDTEAALVMSDTAIRKVSESVDTDLSPEQIRQMVRVTAIPLTKVLQIHVTGQAPEVVEQIAGALAEAYLDVRREYLRVRTAQVLKQMNELLDQIAGLGSHADVNWGIEDANRTQVSVSQADLEEQVQDLLVAPSEAGRILRKSPAKWDRPAREVPVISGLTLGLLVGLLVGSRQEAVERRRDRRSEIQPILSSETDHGRSRPVSQVGI